MLSSLFVHERNWAGEEVGRTTAMHNAASRERGSKHKSIHEISAIPSTSSSCCADVGGHEEGENGKRKEENEGKEGNISIRNTASYNAFSAGDVIWDGIQMQGINV